MKNKRILVIDDEDFIRELIFDILDEEGIPCDTAESFPAAEPLLKSKSYNLILLDRNLAEESAEDVIPKIRAITPDIPITMMTGETEFSKEQLAEFGLLDIIFKPFQFSSFVEKMRQYLET